jgi:threonine synthase
VAAATLADSISVDLPRDGVRAVRAVRETGGAFLTVTDDEILAAMADLGRDAAVFAEPAGAAAHAGLLKAISQGLVKPNEVVVVLNTGSGLKDVKSAMQAVAQAPVVEPDLGAVKEVISNW